MSLTSVGSSILARSSNDAGFPIGGRRQRQESGEAQKVAIGGDGEAMGGRPGAVLIEHGGVFPPPDQKFADHAENRVGRMIDERGFDPADSISEFICIGVPSCRQARLAFKPFIDMQDARQVDPEDRVASHPGSGDVGEPLLSQDAPAWPQFLFEPAENRRHLISVVDARAGAGRNPADARQRSRCLVKSPDSTRNVITLDLFLDKHLKSSSLAASSFVIRSAVLAAGVSRPVSTLRLDVGASRMTRFKLRWDDVEIFCLLADSGSLRQAASQSGQSVETLRRRINALELALGERLFRRTGQGFLITEAGREILDDARCARQAIDAIARQSGADRRRTPLVLRFACPDDVGAMRLLPRLLGRPQNPDDVAIVCDLVAPGDPVDWDRTDLGLLFAEPTQPDLVRRKVGRLRYEVAGRRDVLAAVPPSELAWVLPGERHPWRLAVDTDRIAKRGCGNPPQVSASGAILQLILETGRLGVLPAFALTPGGAVAPVPDFAPAVEVDLWLAFHEHWRSVPTARRLIERVVTLLADPELSPSIAENGIRSQFSPGPGAG